MSNNKVSREEVARATIAATQFVFGLDPRTLLPISLAAPACGKSPYTFANDVTKRPEVLPRLTRIGGRVFVQVKDLIDFLDKPPSNQPATTPGKRGRPTKAEQMARRGVHHG